MPRGICKLCLQEKDLRRSHLLPKALWDLMRENGEEPVVLTPAYVTLSQREVWSHLLCDDCELRFSQLGENVVLPLVQRETNFRLLDLMNVAMSWRNHLNVTTYSGLDMGVDTGALAYFALSVLWRSGARQWTTSKCETTGVSLGGYEEPVRQYLAGEAGFPTGIVVRVTVCTDPVSRIYMFAPTLKIGTRYPTYSMLTRGIMFDIIAGDDLPLEMGNLCCVNSAKKVIFSTSCEDRTVHAGGHVLETAAISDKLR